MLFRLFSSGGSLLETVQSLVFSLIAILCAIIFHEFAHAFVSHLMGDNTAKNMGRMSLNPLNHINLIGFIFLLLFGIGWANPVIINSRNMRRPRLGTVLTSLAGPLMNFICGFIGVFCYLLIYVKGDDSTFMSNLAWLCYYFLAYNISFGVFNLIPFPPLDGSKIFAEALPLKYRYKYLALERYSTYFFIALIILSNYFSIVGTLTEFIINLFGDLLYPLIISL